MKRLVQFSFTINLVIFMINTLDNMFLILLSINSMKSFLYKFNLIDNSFNLNSMNENILLLFNINRNVNSLLRG